MSALNDFNPDDLTKLDYRGFELLLNPESYVESGCIGGCQKYTLRRPVQLYRLSMGDVTVVANLQRQGSRFSKKQNQLEVTVFEKERFVGRRVLDTPSINESPEFFISVDQAYIKSRVHVSKRSLTDVEDDEAVEQPNGDDATIPVANPLPVDRSDSLRVTSQAVPIIRIGYKLKAQPTYIPLYLPSDWSKLDDETKQLAISVPLTSSTVSSLMSSNINEKGHRGFNVDFTTLSKKWGDMNGISRPLLIGYFLIDELVRGCYERYPAQTQP